MTRLQRSSLRRRLFTIASAISLVLCLATMALWVRSYRWEDQMFFRCSSGSAFLTSTAGYLGVDVAKRVYGHREFGLVDRSVVNNDFTSSFEPAPLGFAWRYPYDDAFECAIPHWAAALLFAFAPTFWFYGHFHRARRARLGLCPTCGYDLRATPDKCPECGAEVSSKDSTEPVNLRT